MAFSCGSERSKNFKQPESNTIEFDMPEINKRGKLILLTENSSTSYYIYRGQAIGYDYELIAEFCDEHNLDLEVKVIDDLNEMFSMLDNGQGDIIACNLTVTAERREKAQFTNPLLQTRQVLVQRKPDSWRKLSKRQLQDSLVSTPMELLGLDIHVHAYSSFYSRLKNLEEELGGNINIYEAPGDIDSEELIQKVANKEYKYTVADENVGLLNQTYYPNLDVSNAISFPQNIAWAVRTNSDSLLTTLNSWLSQKTIKKHLAYSYQKYFKAVKNQKERVESEFSSLSGSKISIYDELLKTESEKIGWDWRILAALMYQESRFNPDARSWAGAFGLMQLMPGTAERFGVDSSSSDSANIIAGVQYLKYLNKFWLEKVIDEEERVKFILASYNAGPGHIRDAQKIASLMGMDDQIWDSNVADALKLKSHSKYYSMDVVKHGYCRGDDAFNYVKNIMNYYHHYQSLKI